MSEALTPDERAALESGRHDPRRQLGPLVILRELGRGGMGQVLLAHDGRRGGLVAVKTLLERATPTARARLEREARVLASLAHPGIARLHDAVFEGPGAPYLVMEFVRGRPLSSLVDEDEPMAPRRAATLVCDIARAVAAAHAAGVVHRDLKPQNVMVRAADGHPVVLDFGLARRESGSTVDLTRTGSVVGTLAYLAPEQIGQAKLADAQADVYALGGILFNCLTGRVPFDGPAAVVLAQVMTSPPPAPSEHAPGVPAALDALVLRCLEKDPQARPAGAAEVARALEAWLDAPPEATPVVTPSRPAWPAWLAAALLGALGLSAAAAGLLAARGGLPGSSDAAPPPPSPAPPPVEPRSAPPPALAASEVDRLLLEAAAALDDLVAAEALCTRALALDPTRADAHAVRGQVRSRVGDHRGAAEDYLAAARLERGAVHHHVNAGVNLLRVGERAQALEAFERALALEPDHVAARVGRADVLVDQGRLEAAARDLEVALAREPRSTDALSQLGYLRYKQEDHAGAVEAYTRAIASSPRQAMLWVNRGHNYVMSGRLEDAAADLEEALRLAPDLPAAWKGRAFVRFQADDLAGAIGDLERCLELDPTSSSARRQLDDLRGRLSRGRPASAAKLAEARELLARARALGPGRRDTEELLTRALELAPDLTEAWVARGYSRNRRGASRAAADDYARAARLEPDEPQHLYNLGANLAAADDHAGAVAAYDRALALAPGQAMTVGARAKALQHLGRDAEALAALDEALAARPDDVDLLDALGYVRYRRGEHTAAIEVFTRALALAPERHILRANLAANLAKLGRYEEALRECDVVLAAAPDDLPTRYTRGAARLEVGDVAGAIEDLTRAQALAPDDRGVARLLARARERERERAGR